MSDSNATITRLALIKRAFRRIGKRTPTQNDIADAVALLNDKLKEIDADTKLFWAVSNTPTALSIISGTKTYAVGTPPTAIAPYLMSLVRFELVKGTSLWPLQILDKVESVSTYEREKTGEPYEVHLERFPDPANNRLWVYPTPASNYTAQYYGRRRLYDFDNAGDTPDVPQEMNQLLVKLLAAELAPEYGLGLDEQQKHEAHAKEAMNKIFARNNESKTRTPARNSFF